MEHDPLEARREKRRRKGRRRLLVAVILIGVVLAGGAVVGVVAGVQAVAGGARDSWTHRELAAHLKAKGVAVRVEPGPDIGGPGRPVADFSDGTGEVRVYLCATPQAAREEAGSWPSHAFGWGRFAICSRGGAAGNALHDRIKAALD